MLKSSRIQKLLSSKMFDPQNFFSCILYEYIYDDDGLFSSFEGTTIYSVKNEKTQKDEIEKI